MIPMARIFDVIAVAASLLLLLLLSAVYVWFGKLAQARAEQRHGIAKLYLFGLPLIFLEATKALRIKKGEGKFSSVVFVYSIRMILPAIFFVILLCGSSPGSNVMTGLSLLSTLLILDQLMYVALATTFKDGTVRLVTAETAVVVLAAAATLILSFLPLILRLGSAAFVTKSGGLSSLGALFFWNSPGGVLTAVTSFIGMFIFLGMGPGKAFEGADLGDWHALAALWAHRMWVIALTAYWVFLNFGGVGHTFSGVVSFIIRVLLVLVVMIWIDIGIMRVRWGDLARFVVATLVPLAFLAVLVDVIWTVVRA